MVQDGPPLVIWRKDVLELSRKNKMHNKNGNVKYEDIAKTGKLHLVLKGLEANNVGIAGLSEIRWQGKWHIQSGETLSFPVEQYVGMAVYRSSQ